MTQTVDILDGINAEALAYQRAKGRYEKAFWQFGRSVPPLAPEHFWPMADSFRQVLLESMLFRKEGVPVHAANEFLRQAVVGQSPYSLSAAVHFCLSYRCYKNQAYEGADKCHFDWGRGDDAFGDMVDAVVLLGREFNARLYACDFASEKRFCEAVREVCQASVTTAAFPFQYADDPAGERMSLASRLAKMVLSGENYFASSLEDEAQRWVAIESIQNAPEEE